MTARLARRTVVRVALASAGIVLATACTAGESAPAPLPQWSFDPSMIFPTDRSLTRPEDGIALADGRLIVTDQVHGLRLVQTDGSSAPFGDMPGAGYAHRPPDRNGGANGVSLEPNGTHMLVADIFGGGIYRVDVASGATERVYQHTHGVNTAERDSKGAIWFTQSAANTPEAGEGRMWASVDAGAAEGKLLRLASQDGVLAAQAEVVVDSLFFANGVAIDEKAGHLYVAETVGGRVLRFRVDVATGRLSERTVFAEIAADNMRLDGEGHLWVASPLNNELLVLNTATGERHSAFHLQSPAQLELIAEFNRRGKARAPRLELITPDLWTPLPGLVTGVIVSKGGGPVYLTGLGDALVRLTR